MTRREEIERQRRAIYDSISPRFGATGYELRELDRLDAELATLPPDAPTGETPASDVANGPQPDGSVIVGANFRKGEPAPTMDADVQTLLDVAFNAYKATGELRQYACDPARMQVAIDAILARFPVLCQPASDAGQEPVAWRYRFQFILGQWSDWHLSKVKPLALEKGWDFQPLYAAPQPTPPSHARGVALEEAARVAENYLQSRLGAAVGAEIRKLALSPQPVRPGDGVREDGNAFLEQAGKALYEHEFGPECTNTEFPAWEATRGPLRHRYRRRAEVVLAAAGLLRREGEAR